MPPNGSPTTVTPHADPDWSADATRPARVTPHLRLTDHWAPANPRTPADPADPAAPPALDPADPRWVLARRAAEQLDGATLSPDRRDRLVRLGKLMGLTAFDAHLVLAVVQDQARRGVDPVYCPAAGVAQLAVIPGPQPTPRRIGRVWLLVAAALLAELALGAWLLLR